MHFSEQLIKLEYLSKTRRSRVTWLDWMSAIGRSKELRLLWGDQIYVPISEGHVLYVRSPSLKDILTNFAIRFRMSCQTSASGLIPNRVSPATLSLQWV